MQVHAFLTAVLDGGSGELHALAALLSTIEPSVSFNRSPSEIQSKPEWSGGNEQLPTLPRIVFQSPSP
jgi:hypothetical protein